MFEQENRNEKIHINNKKKRFVMLEEMLYSFSELPRLSSVCQGVINFAKMDYMKRTGDTHVLEPIFNLDIKGVLATAE
jgi:hypothetical protein